MPDAYLAWNYHYKMLEELSINWESNNLKKKPFPSNVCEKKIVCEIYIYLREKLSDPRDL